jgi:hypothetical protein
MPWETLYVYLSHSESQKVLYDVWIHLLHYSRRFFQTILQVQDPVTFVKYWSFWQDVVW